MRSFAQGHTASKQCWNWDLNPCSLVPESATESSHCAEGFTRCWLCLVKLYHQHHLTYALGINGLIIKGLTFFFII